MKYICGCDNRLVSGLTAILLFLSATASGEEQAKKDWHVPIDFNAFRGVGMTSGQSSDTYQKANHRLNLEGVTTSIGLISPRLAANVGVDIVSGKTSEMNALNKPEVEVNYFGLSWSLGKDTKYLRWYLVGSHGMQYTNTTDAKKVSQYGYAAYGGLFGVTLLQHEKVGSLGLFGSYRHYLTHGEIDQEELMGKTMHAYLAGLSVDLYLDQVGKILWIGLCFATAWGHSMSDCTK